MTGIHKDAAMHPFLVLLSLKYCDMLSHRLLLLSGTLFEHKNDYITSYILSHFEHKNDVMIIIKFHRDL